MDVTMNNKHADLSKTINLIRELTWSDFKLRYKGSMLGFLWSFLKPLLLMSVLYVVFALVLNTKTENYVLFLLLGLIMWNFFVESTTISMHNILVKRYLIKAVYFPRKILVISSVLNAGMTLLFNLVIFLIIYSFFFTISILTLVFLFLELLMLFILSLGVAYLLSALYVTFRDVLYIWEVFSQMGFWITPIAYSITMVPEKYSIIYIINPLSQIITGARDILLLHTLPNLIGQGIALIICIIIYLIGSSLYKTRSKYFAEEL
jgi:lipopolysaccharide transport system permease protein